MKPIKDFEELYSIDEKGNVWSCRFKIFLKHCVTSKGYYTVLLRNGKNKRRVGVHRLLAETFVENPSRKEFVDHINRNKLDNSLSNLRWATKSENAINQGKCRTNNSLKKSKYKGVSWDKSRSKWIVVCTDIDRVKRNIGRFEDEKEAAKKYNDYVFNSYGDFAFLNDIS